jgi:peptide-methionine (S)-S-oxide reductase
MTLKSSLVIGAAILALGVGSLAPSASAEDLRKQIPAPTLDAPKTGAATTETAVLAGGCFWGQQGVFEHVKGVTKVVAGYSGGKKETAHYQLVGTETTGHAESVEITFDPRVVSFGDLLKIYFSVSHDPTQLNRQGPDSGPSYRSEIFFNTPMQQKIAEAYVKQLTDAKIFPLPIVTRIEANKGFYPAEDYHQDYLIYNPNAGYIVVNDLPKIAALKKVWPNMYRDQPVMLKTASLN